MDDPFLPLGLSETAVKAILAGAMDKRTSRRPTLVGPNCLGKTLLDPTLAIDDRCHSHQLTTPASEHDHLNNDARPDTIYLPEIVKLLFFFSWPGRPRLIRNGP